MSKELEALEKLFCTFKPYLDENEYIKEDFKIIETALKRLERHDNIRITEEQAQWLVDNFANLQKKLKALEIIVQSNILSTKERPERLYMLEGVGGVEITKEECELLDEVLADDRDSD